MTCQSGTWPLSRQLKEGNYYNCCYINWNYQFAYDEFGYNDHETQDEWNMTASHELFHALGHIWDTYRVYVADHPGEDVYFHYAANYGVMGPASHWQTLYLPGFQKAQLRWVPTLWIVNDFPALAVNEAGVPGNTRECYYIGPQGTPGREFFTVENVGVHPYMNDRHISGYTGSLTGILVIHHKLSREGITPEERAAEKHHPYYCWVMADGSEPYRNAYGEWIHPYNQTTPQQWLYPYGSDRLDNDPESIPNSRLWDGTDSGIVISEIESHDSMKLDMLPVNFETDPAWVKQQRYWHHYYGVYTMNVDVDNPLKGDCNMDGIVNQADYEMLKLNFGRCPGVDDWLVPLDINGDGVLSVVPDRDGDKYISTSERIYDDDMSMNFVRGDWLDLDCNGKNDLDPRTTGEYDAADFDLDGDGLIDCLDPDGDDVAEKVPQLCDPNGNGIVDEQDLAWVGYNWGKTAIIEQWINTPVIY